MAKTVYLSLEELHKKHGISPAVIAAIKKKKRKRRKKKDIKKAKINNGTMGNTPSDSSHMKGSSNALAVATTQLNNANMNKHINDVNENNDKLRIENEEKQKNLMTIGKDIKLLNYAKDMKTQIESGKIQLINTSNLAPEQKQQTNLKLHTSSKVEDLDKAKDKHLLKQIKAQEKQTAETQKAQAKDEKRQNALIEKRLISEEKARVKQAQQEAIDKQKQELDKKQALIKQQKLDEKQAQQEAIDKQKQNETGLDNTDSNHMGKEFNETSVIDYLLYGDGFVGSLELGTDSLNFTSEQPAVFNGTENDNNTKEAAPGEDVVGTSNVEDVRSPDGISAAYPVPVEAAATTDPNFDPGALTLEQQAQQQEQPQDPLPDPNAKVEIPYTPQPFSFYKKVDQLNQIAKANHIPLTQKHGKKTSNIYTKEMLYTVLVDKKLA